MTFGFESKDLWTVGSSSLGELPKERPNQYREVPHDVKANEKRTLVLRRFVVS